MIGNYGGAPSGTGGGPGERRPEGDTSQDVEENIVEESTKSGELSEGDLVELYYKSIAYSPKESGKNDWTDLPLDSLISVYLTENEKKSVEQLYKENRPADNEGLAEIVKKLTHALILLIRNNGLMSEVLGGDPFLRRRHVKYLVSGKLEHGSPIKERQNEIAEFLWSLDGGFYESEEICGFKPGNEDELTKLYDELIAHNPESMRPVFIGESGGSGQKTFPLDSLISVNLTENEKKSVEQLYKKNLPVDDKELVGIVEKFTDKLRQVIEDNHLMSEVLGDPFLRKRHIEYLIRGELESNSPIEERQTEIAKFLWSLDGGFYESEGVRDLISDEHGERRNLFLLRVLNQGYGRDNVWRASSKDERGRIVEQYGALVSALTKSGVTLRQLVKDPFLRKEHFDKLLELETGEGEYSEAKAKLWSFDEGFTESEDYYKMMKRRISEHPEIYEHPDKTEIDRLTDSVVQGISADKVMNIMANYRENMRSGDEELRRILLEAVGFRDKNNLPEIEYSELRGGEEGRYDWRNNKIIIDEDGIRYGLVRSSISFVDEEDLLVNNNPRMNNNDELIRRRIDVIAQEIWHACEWRGNLADNERGRMYKENFVYYVDGGDNEFSSRQYRSQLIEAEAWTFAGKVMNLIRRANFVSKFAAKTMDLVHNDQESDSDLKH